ncbi:hypothetical protein VHEMI09961 [[Torrubiella] hemipterigena]|uniref:ABC transporter domain-containing protein n=1 Tax=[Torrubiella] hemipterigena TaxID=1531966 RepID=A0A0A1TSG1_9HYPO|nr:hypothetical protein VHEMI09961 [[Torrubiella] hemipterigena]
MELTSSENVYTGFDEIVSGLAHLESFDWIENRSTQVHGILEDSQQVYCHHLALKRWLSMVSDLFGTIFTGAYILLVSSKSTSPFVAGIGLSLCLYMKLAIGYTIENLTTLDKSATIVQQMQEFMRDMPQEPERALARIEGEWPSRCMIDFENVSIGYNLPNSPPLISGINLRIFGREAALCGTFNSGKTTFFLSMVARLPYTGSIKIDGIEARTIPREQFNSVFTVVPQDPILFHNATIRKNLLPDEIMEAQDQQGCEVVLERILAGVGLSAIVERNGGILSQFSTLNLSYEQNQRFSLAQGLVQYFFNPTKMALIDGVTDNVSNESLDRMTSMMREMFQFGECSIISTTNRPPSHITAPWLAEITRPVPTAMTSAN